MCRIHVIHNNIVVLLVRFVNLLKIMKIFYLRTFFSKSSICCASIRYHSFTIFEKKCSVSILHTKIFAFGYSLCIDGIYSPHFYGIYVPLVGGSHQQCNNTTKDIFDHLSRQVQHQYNKTHLIALVSPTQFTDHNYYSSCLSTA